MEPAEVFEKFLDIGSEAMLLADHSTAQLARMPTEAVIKGPSGDLMRKLIAQAVAMQETFVEIRVHARGLMAEAGQ